MSPSQPTTILITGASSGIGAALAMDYAVSGTTLYLCARNQARLDDVAARCQAKGARVDACVVDVTDRAAMQAWISTCDAATPLDLVIANAGVSAGTTGGEKDEQTRDIFAVNMAGTLNTVGPAMALMKPRSRGQIAMVASLAGFMGLASSPAYAASKAAVKVYGEGLRGRLADHGIKVSVICPGFVTSRITARNRFAMPMLMSAEKAARIIRKGLARNRPRIAFPFPMYALVWLTAALPPGLTEAVLRRLPRKE